MTNDDIAAIIADARSQEAECNAAMHCIVCGDPFPTSHRGGQFCSYECAAQPGPRRETGR